MELPIFFLFFFFGLVWFGLVESKIMYMCYVVTFDLGTLF